MRTSLSVLRGLALCLPAFIIAASAACSSGSDDNNSGASNLTTTQLTGRSLPAKTIALTFDDGPGARTEELSGFLKELGIQAGFFMLGNAASGKGKVLNQVNADGHVIGNHTFDHALLTSSKTDPVGEIRKADAILSPFFTGNMHMFRAPFGGWSANVANARNNAGFSDYVGSIFWDIGGELTSTHAADWDCWGHGTKAKPHQPLSVAECGRRYVQEIHDRGDRGVVLMHDIHSNTVDMVKLIVPQLMAQGFKFVRIDSVPAIHDQLVAKGATPGSSQPPDSPPMPAAECGDDGDTDSFAICGQLVGKDSQSLFNCSNHHLSLACKCQDDCLVAAHGSSCTCDGAEPGEPATFGVIPGLYGSLALESFNGVITGSVHDGACEFTVAGQITNANPINLSLLMPGATGQVQLQLVDDTTVSITSSDLPSACASVIDASGAPLKLRAKLSPSVIAFRTVQAAKSFFHDGPGFPAKSTFVIQGQTLQQLAEASDGFVKVRFAPPSGALTTGFVAEAELMPVGADGL